MGLSDEERMMIVFRTVHEMTELTKVVDSTPVNFSALEELPSLVDQLYPLLLVPADDGPIVSARTLLCS